MLSILVVDDEFEICEVLNKFLQSKGHKVKTTQSGKEALRLINNEKMDIVLLDLMMPEMNGEDVLKEIRKNYPNIPVIMITVTSCDQKAIELLSLGASDYITKPVDFSYLEKYLSIWDKLSNHEFLT